MGEKDIVEKNLEAWNDVFADIVNVLLFKGKRLVKEQDLEADTKDSMFKALTGDKHFETVYNQSRRKEKRGGITMERIFDDYLNKGIEKGREETIKKLLEANALTTEQIAEILKLPLSEVKKIASKVPVEA